MVPLVGAIAAGNCAIVKPSEVAPATSALIASRLPDTSTASACGSSKGASRRRRQLLAERFDHIFYTGNGTVGRIVMEAAAKHLTPVTLELGGKSPCIVDRHTDLDVAARRIVWGKFYNAGQTCVAPDYVLAHEAIEEPLLARMKQTLHDFFGDDPRTGPDFGRIVNARHHRRLMKLLEGSGEIVTGGVADEPDRYIAPTILRNVPADAPVMADEIFGPILPVLRVKDIDQAIAFVNARPKPLALYLFTNDRAVQESVLERTSSGGVTVNHTLLHLAVPSLPFGGVGASGMGAYHGKATFETFSHRKAVLVKPTWLDPWFFYPPYNDAKKKWVRRVIDVLTSDPSSRLTNGLARPQPQKGAVSHGYFPARPDGARRMGQRGLLSRLGSISRPRPRGAAPSPRPPHRGSARVLVGVPRRAARRTKGRAALDLRRPEDPRQTCHAGLRDFAASLEPETLARTVRIPWFPDPPCVITVAEAVGAGCDALAAPSRPVHDPAQGFRRRAQKRGLDHLAVEAEAAGAGGAEPAVRAGSLELACIIFQDDGAAARHRRKGPLASRLVKEREMAEDRYLEDFSVGQTFRSGTITVEPEQIKSFASQFDPQPFHLDETAAAASFFGGLVASGWHTAALTMRLLVDSELKIAGGLIGAGDRRAQVATARTARRHAPHCIRSARGQALEVAA